MVRRVAFRALSGTGLTAKYLRRRVPVAAPCIGTLSAAEKRGDFSRAVGGGVVSSLPVADQFDECENDALRTEPRDVAAAAPSQAQPVRRPPALCPCSVTCCCSAQRPARAPCSRALSVARQPSALPAVAA